MQGEGASRRYTEHMCGRISQPRSLREYGENLGVPRNPFPDEPIGHYNGSPGVPHWTFRVHDESLIAEPITWHYLSGWAKKKGLAPAINAQLEKLLTPYYRSLMKAGRIIVPADGWYEWTGAKGQRVPWYIKPKNGDVLFFAGLTNHVPDEPDEEGVGFVIVTNGAAGGMIDIHDRRPVALTAADARLWLDPDIHYEQATEIARTSELGEDYFEWYRVSTTVNRPGPNGSELIEPIAE